MFARDPVYKPLEKKPVKHWLLSVLRLSLLPRGGSPASPGKIKVLLPELLPNKFPIDNHMGKFCFAGLPNPACE